VTPVRQPAVPHLAFYPAPPPHHKRSQCPKVGNHENRIPHNNRRSVTLTRFKELWPVPTLWKRIYFFTLAHTSMIRVTPHNSYSLYQYYCLQCYLWLTWSSPSVTRSSGKYKERWLLSVNPRGGSLQPTDRGRNLNSTSCQAFDLQVIKAARTPHLGEANSRSRPKPTARRHARNLNMQLLSFIDSLCYPERERNSR